jgi:RNA polymerase sigma-70 factor (ECF subfamily)
MEPFDVKPPPGSLEELVKKAQRGDTVAMNLVLDRLLPDLGRLCGAIALSDGPDALQDCAIVILGQLRQLRQPAALWAWARKIATREAVRHATRAQRRHEQPLAFETPASDADHSTAARLAVRQQLERLPVEQRAILYLRDVEGLDEAEAAEVLGVAQGTVKSRLHRARQAFKKEWNE